MACSGWVSGTSGPDVPNSRHCFTMCFTLLFRFLFLWSLPVQPLSRVWLLATRKPQHARPPCPSPTPRIYPNPFPLSQWCHPTISSSVVPFSSRLQSFPASGSFQMSQLFASLCQNANMVADRGCCWLTINLLCSSLSVRWYSQQLFFFFFLNIYLFLPALGLSCGMWTFHIPAP